MMSIKPLFLMNVGIGSCVPPQPNPLNKSNAWMLTEMVRHPNPCFTSTPRQRLGASPANRLL